MPKGQPPYTAADVDRVLEEISIGRTITDVCLNCEFAPDLSMFCRWVNEDRWELQSRYAAARRIAADIRADLRIDKLTHQEEELGTYSDAQMNTRVDVPLARLAYTAEREWRARYHPEAWEGRQTLATDEDTSTKQLNVIAVPIKDLMGVGATPDKEEPEPDDGHPSDTSSD